MQRARWVHLVLPVLQVLPVPQDPLGHRAHLDHWPHLVSLVLRAPPVRFAWSARIAPPRLARRNATKESLCYLPIAAPGEIQRRIPPSDPRLAALARQRTIRSSSRARSLHRPESPPPAYTHAEPRLTPRVPVSGFRLPIEDRQESESTPLPPCPRGEVVCTGPSFPKAFLSQSVGGEKPAKIFVFAGFPTKTRERPDKPYHNCQVYDAWGLSLSIG